MSTVAQQAHYTSTPAGLSGGAGFQFAAASPGLGEDVLRSLERVVLYQPPLDAPAEPTDREIAQLPVSFAVRRLQTGQLALVRSIYTGRDYSGRFGNFFSHAIVLTDEADLGYPPIAYRRASFWTERTPSSDHSLQPLPMGDAPPPLDVNAALRTLAESRRAERVAIFASGVLLALSGERRVLLVDDPGAAADWLVVVSALLPSELARALTFTTYDRAPRRVDVDIAATTASGELDVAPYELSSELVVVDATGGDDSLGVLEESLFGRVLASLVGAGDAEGIETFRAETVARIEGVLAVEDVGPALALHLPFALDLEAGDLMEILAMLSRRPRSAMGATELGWLFDDLLASPDAVDSVAAVVRAGAAAGRAETADALVALGITWLVAHPEVDPSVLEELEMPGEAPERALRAWKDRVTTTTREGLASAIRVGASIDALRGGGLPDEVRATLKELIGTDPASEAAAAALRFLPDSEAEHLVRVGLAAVGGNRDRARAWSELAANRDVKPLLSRVRRAPADFKESLGAAAVALESGDASPERALTFLFGQARSDDDALEATSMCLGSTDPLDPVDAAIILSAGARRAVPWVGGLERVERALLAAGSIDRPPAEVTELVERARTVDALARRPVLLAHALAESRPRKGRPAVDWLREAENLRDSLAPELTSEVERLAARVVLDLDAADLRKVLDDSSRRRDPWLYKRCCALANDALREPKDPGLAARWFEAFIEDGGRNGSSASRVFNDAVGQWRAKDRGKVEAGLRRSSREAWRHWSWAHPAPRGVLSRTFRRPVRDTEERP